METTITVVGAKGLNVGDPNGLSDPYCKLGAANASGDYISAESAVFSEVRHCTINPVWTRAKVSCDPGVASVRVEVWDKDVDKADDFLGVAVIKLGEAASGDHWIELSGRTSDEKVRGSIHYVIFKTSFKANALVLNHQEQRLVRVFLSSTFLDMHGEREIIMRKVMVELDKFCLARSVSLSYIDMRWGITNEMGKQNMTIIRCLQEVDNSRPYFVGLIGHRYGWHQETKGTDVGLTKTFELAADHPEEYEDRSVTELEVLHGFLAHPSVPEQHSFFFFRGSEFLASVPQNKRSDYEDTSAYAISRVNELKQNIKAKADKGLCVVTEYKAPAEIEAPLLQQLKAAIERDFPILDEAQEEFLQRQAEHENFAHRLATAYVSNPVQLNYLNTATSSSKGYILVVGESGSGKSSYLANWWITNQKAQQLKEKRPIFVHFIGASSLASSLHTVLLRLFEEINSMLVIEDKIPIPNESDLIDAVPRFLDAISAKGGIVIIFDAVNQLPAEHHDLAWLPRVLPARVHVVVSAVPEGRVAEEITTRGAKVIKMLPLDTSDKRELVAKRLNLYGKAMPSVNVEKLVLHKLSSSPLFLTTVLIEMCIVAHYRIFDQVFNDFMACTDMPSLFERVITRWEDTHGKDLVKKIVLLIAAARSGISESVIQQITNSIPAEFFPLMSAIRATTVISQGKLNFYHDFVLQAVNKNMYSSEDLKSARRDLVKYWKAAKFDQPTAFELPWLLSELAKQGDESAQKDLGELLLNLDNFAVFHSKDFFKFELLKYWNTLSKLNSKWSLSLYSAKAEEYKAQNEPERATTLLNLVTWLAYAGSLQEPIAKLSQTVYEKLDDKAGTSQALAARCMILEQQGKFVEAEKVAKESLTLTVSAFGDNSKEAAASVSSVAVINMRQGRLEDAILGFKTALTTRTALKQEKDIAQSLNQLGVALTQKGDYTEAQECLNKAISIRSSLFGDKHPLVADSIENLANLFRDQPNFTQAKEAYDKVLKIRTELYGEPHPAIASTLGNLGELHTKAGKLGDGLQYLTKALEMHKAVYGEVHPTVASSLNNLAMHASVTGNFSEALAMQLKALAIRTQLFGEINQDVAKTITNIAVVHTRSGQLELALEQFKRALETQVKLFGESHSTVADTQTNIGKLFSSMGKLDASLEVHQKALTSRKALFGDVSAPVAQSLSSIAEVYHTQGKEKEAEDYYKKALEVSTAVFGGSHRTVAMALHNLATVLISNNEETKEKLEEGLKLAMRSVQVHVEAYGPKHPEVASAYALQAAGLKNLELNNDALDSALKGLSIGKETLGEDHPRMAHFNQVVGTIYHIKGQDVESQKHLDRAKAIREKSSK